jgi:AcrR family transcriptional regulator
VIAEAATVADQVGFEQLSLAAVAARTGVRLPSLYKHIASLDDLRAGVAELGTRELAESVSEAAIGRSGEDALVAVATAYRRFGHDHPGRYAATVRAPAPDDAKHQAAAAAVLRVVLAVLAGYRLEGDDAIDATRAIRAALHGFLTLEAGGGFGMVQDVDRSFDRMVGGMHLALTSWPHQVPAPMSS